MHMTWIFPVYYASKLLDLIDAHEEVMEVACRGSLVLLPLECPCLGHMTLKLLFPVIVLGIMGGEWRGGVRGRGGEGKKREGRGEERGGEGRERGRGGGRRGEGMGGRGGERGEEEGGEEEGGEGREGEEGGKMREEGGKMREGGRGGGERREGEIRCNSFSL